ncbi:MAG: hypothetical protein Q9184_000670 [Pyrenodesmia sp. 2 TL-2023]
MAKRNNSGGVHKNRPPHNGYNTRGQAQGQFIVVPAPSADTAGAGNNNRGKAKGNRGRGSPNTRGGQAQVDKQHQLQQHKEHDKSRNKLVTFVVRGVSESSAGNDNDNGLARCSNWLADWARNRLKRPGDYVFVKNPKWVDNDMVFQVAENDAWRIRQADGQQFLNVTLSVQQADTHTKETQQPTQNPAAPAITPAQRTQLYRDVLSNRYNEKDKILTLDGLHEDWRLQVAGSWDPTGTRHSHTDVFPGLMRVLEESFSSRAEKEERVQGVSLMNNRLTTFGPVFELAKTFPDLRGLDLSNNNIKDLKSLDTIKYRFRRLERLIISPNPIDVEDPEYHETVKGWFKTLIFLNEDRVRSDEAAANAASQSAPIAEIPLATIKDNFQDEAGIAESAVKELIMGTDNDRPTLVRSLYDNESTFSISYNPSAPRLDTAKAVSWEPHLKQSRNLKKVFQLDPRIKRLATGISEIESALKILPPTRHPDLINDSPKYSFDCTPIPNVPDPYDRLESGVGGLKVDVHGSFEEYDRNTGLQTAIRSFDRCFILGPGLGENKLRIVSDILTLRAHGGYEAFNPETKCMPDLPMVTTHFGFSPNLKAEEEVNKAFLTEQLSRATGLTGPWATQLLSVSDWNFQIALENFNKAKVSH